MFGAHFIKVVFRIQPRIQGRLPYMGGFAIFQFTEVAIHSRGLAKFGAYCLFCLLHTLLLWRIARLAVLFECFSCLDVEGCFVFKCVWSKKHFLSKFETECHRTCMNMESHSWFTKQDIQTHEVIWCYLPSTLPRCWKLVPTVVGDPMKS